MLESGIVKKSSPDSIPIKPSRFQVKTPWIFMSELTRETSTSVRAEKISSKKLVVGAAGETTGVTDETTSRCAGGPLSNCGRYLPRTDRS